MKIYYLFYIFIIFSVSVYAEDVKVYHVKQGDTLKSIAKNFYGSEDKWEEIKEDNPDISSNGVKSGEILVLYPSLNKKEKLEEKVEAKKSKPIAQKQVKKSIEKKALPKVNNKITLKKHKAKIKKEKIEKPKLTKAKKEIPKIVKDNSWALEKESLLNEISDLRSKMRKSANRRPANDYTFVKNRIAIDKEQVLKEKSEILSQRLWVEKNRNLNKCELKVEDDFSWAKDKLFVMIDEFQSKFGQESVIIDSADNSILFSFPGNMVTGIINPNVNREYLPMLHEIFSLSKKLPINSIRISSYYYKDIVKDSRDKAITKDIFSIVQSSEIANYMIDYLNVPADLIEVSSHAPFIPSSKTLKLFNFKLSFEKKFLKEDKRTVASIESSYESLGDFSRNVLSAIGEPDGASFKYDNKSYQIHIPRSYFFAGTNDHLTRRGRNTIEKMFKIFSLREDIGLVIKWVPGQREVDIKSNYINGKNHIRSMQSYIKQVNPKKNSNVEYSVYGRYHNSVNAFKNSEDYLNRRIIFEIQPYSANSRFYTN